MEQLAARQNHANLSQWKSCVPCEPSGSSSKWTLGDLSSALVFGTVAGGEWSRLGCPAHTETQQHEVHKQTPLLDLPRNARQGWRIPNSLRWGCSFTVVYLAMLFQILHQKSSTPSLYVQNWNPLNSLVLSVQKIEYTRITQMNRHIL